MSNSGKKPTDDDEVEQLLRAAQDDMLLKLNINSHMSRAAAINPDLDRRFQALKKPTKVEDRVPIKIIDDDDLLARFAALKNSIPSHSRSEKKDGESINEPVTDDEDEVEKVIKWAIDAARLDPSPPSDDDEDEDDDGGKTK